MRLISLLAAATWVDFVVMVITKLLPSRHLSFLPSPDSLKLWYDKFGVAAVTADVFSLMIGVLLATLLFPGAYGISLVFAAIFVQILHDLFFYIVVIRGLPQGHNAMIDVFKTYADQGGWTILFADALMVGSTVLLAELYDLVLPYRVIALKAILGMYALIYITYTK